MAGNEELKKIIQKTKANGHYPDRISRLKSRVVALSEEKTKLKTENKWYSEQLKEAVKEIGQLKELLKRAKEVLEEGGDYMIVQEINQVLGEE